MVTSNGEGIGLLAKLVRAIIKSEGTTEEREEAEPTERPGALEVENLQAGPMNAYWATDKKAFKDNNQHFIDIFKEGKALERISDTTEAPVIESQYQFIGLKIYQLQGTQPNQRYEYNINDGVTDPPKTGTGISSSGRDAGVVAGIVVAVISGVLILAGLIAVVLYKHYVHRNVTSMNFDNPVYRKTTEDQFALEKNGYAPGSKLYPSTVGEEAREPLNTPGTNEYV